MAATPSPNYNDKQLLAADPTFQNRVRQSMLTQCANIKSEAVTVAFHRERETFLVAVVNNPEYYKPMFASVVASDTSCIADATVAGTIPLTPTNTAAQATLVTDTHIDNSISANFNAFFRTPAN